MLLVVVAVFGAEDKSSRVGVLALVDASVSVVVDVLVVVGDATEYGYVGVVSEVVATRSRNVNRILKFKGWINDQLVN